MSTRFDAAQGLVVVPIQLWGPRGRAVLRLAVDTGATSTLLSSRRLARLGYDVRSTTEVVRLTTGSGVVEAPRLRVDRLLALDREQHVFPVVCHDLPPSASVDGLLGLDFMRGQRLTVDFRAGEVSLN